MGKTFDVNSGVIYGPENGKFKYYIVMTKLIPDLWLACPRTLRYQFPWVMLKY